MGDNGRAVAYGQHELEPSHVDLHGSGAAPLTGFEQDEAYRHAGLAHIFKYGYELTLRAVENELDEATRYFVLYDDEQRRPKREVVLYADADKRLDYVVDVLLVVFPPLAAHEVLDGLGGKQLLYELIIHHLHRQPHNWRGRHILDFDLDALADGTLAGDGVERSGDCGKAAVVFLEDGF